VAKASNDKIERHYFEQFQKYYSLPDGCVTYGDKPDIIVRGANKIGIEITNIHVQPETLPESEQRQIPLRRAIVVEAQRIYLADGGKPIKLTFSFDKENYIRSDRKKALTADLAMFARSCESQSDGEVNRILFRDLMPELRSIYLSTKKCAETNWLIIQDHALGPMSKVNLERIVREKERKAAGYELCDAYWLLLIVDGINSAQDQEIRIDDPHVTSNVFEKIIVFHTFGHIVESK
jgi:hypothetical protein